MDTFFVPSGYGEAEHTERRSRFIGRVWPAGAEEDALARIKSTREEFWDAGHNVYAYIIRENAISRFSDDGEPGGSSGLPTLNVFKMAGVQNVVCTVTRYFGGILLGVGGLQRAYSKAAKLALDAAGISEMRLTSLLEISVAYSSYDRVARFIRDFGAAEEKVSFGEAVLISALVDAGEKDRFTDSLANLTSGTAEIFEKDCGFRPVKLPMVGGK